MSTPVDISALMLRAVKRRAYIASLVKPSSRSFLLVPTDPRALARGNFYIVSRACYPLAMAWRVTYFDSYGPSGHSEHASPVEALEDLFRSYGTLEVKEAC